MTFTHLVLHCIRDSPHLRESRVGVPLTLNRPPTTVLCCFLVFCCFLLDAVSSYQRLINNSATSEFPEAAQGNTCNCRCKVLASRVTQGTEPFIGSWRAGQGLSASAVTSLSLPDHTQDGQL